MTDRKPLATSLVITFVLLALNLVAFNLLLSHWSTARIDLTDDRLYSISPATKRILTGLDEQVTILGYFSKRTHPKLAPLVPQIEDMLDEYRALSRGKVRVEITDPSDNDAVEQEAINRYGVESTPFRLASKYETGIVNAYFAIVVRYADQYVRYGFDDLIEIEPTPDGDVDVRLRNLEYDLTRAIKKVVFGFRTTAELFERVDEPVKLTVVVTPDSVPEALGDVVESVRLAAEELAEKGGDKFLFEEIDPGTDEAVEEQVYQRFGARPMTLGLFSDEQFYLYGFLEVAGRLEQLDLTAEGVSAATVREAIENSLRRQTPGFLKTVGVVTSEQGLPREILMQLQMQGQRVPPQPPPEFEQIKARLRLDYQVRDLKLDSPVPTEVDTLLVLKPDGLSETEVYNLDQYLMRGGRVIIAASAFQPQLNPNAGGLSVTPLTSGLEDWLGHLGVEIEPTLVLDDRNQPLPIPEVQRTPLGLIQTWRMEPYPYLVEVRDEGLANRQITSRLDSVGIYWGSPLTVDSTHPDGLEVTEILKSSPRSWTDDDTTKVGYVDYQVPQEGVGPELLAVSLTGKFPSYFQDREPPGSDGEAAEEDAAVAKPTEVALEQSPDTRLVVIGDAAFVSDLVARALGLDSGFFASNLAFVQNLIDWINLDNDMLTIRSRGTGVRRLSRVERGTEVTIEIVNYMIPILALLIWGAYRYWRRRHAVPLVATATTRRAQA